MFLDTTNAILKNSFLINNNPNFSTDFMKNEFLDMESPFQPNFSSQEELSLLSDDTKSRSSFWQRHSMTLSLPLEENVDNLNDQSSSNLFSLESLQEKEQEKQPLFEVVYPKNDLLFSKTEKNSGLISIEETEETFLKRKRLPIRKPRKDNQDNMRKKIKRGFFNTALINILNQKLESLGSSKYFEKFPQFFVSDVNQKRNKEIFSMTLSEILEKKELYENEQKSGFDNYLHNLKVVQSEDIKENEELKIIFKKKICELYEEYFNSDEFKIGEINRLKEKNMTDDYIARYIYLANHLIEFLFQ